jgi:hypothetical protein
MTEYIIQSSESIIYRTKIEAESLEEALQKAKTNDGEIVNRHNDIVNKRFEISAIYNRYNWDTLFVGNIVANTFIQ